MSREQHIENDHWFDGQNGLLEKVRILRSFMSDSEIAERLSNRAKVEEIWLCLKAAEILDGKRE